MTLQGLNAEDRFLATSAEIFARHEVRLEVGQDFERYREILAEGRPDHTLGAPFDPKLHDLGPGKGLWIVGRDADDQVMHTQAMRVLPLNGETLGTYLRRNFRDFPPSGLPIDMERSRFKAGPGARRIAGKVIYHGEVWMSPAGKYRGTGLSSILGRTAFLSSLRHFQPDWMFGFMPRQVAFKGFVERQGYMHAEPFALRWYLEGKPDPLEGFLAYMSAEDLSFVLDMPQAELEALAA